MGQPHDENTQNLAEQLCWEVARRDDSRVARRLYRKQLVDGVYRLDEGALLDDFFHFLELFPGLQQLCRVPLPIRQRCPGTPDGCLGQPQRCEPRDHSSSTQEQATAQEHPQEMKEAEIRANGHMLDHTRQDEVHSVDYR